jgi:hypothetical protein
MLDLGSLTNSEFSTLSFSVRACASLMTRMTRRRLNADENNLPRVGPACTEAEESRESHFDSAATWMRDRHHPSSTHLSTSSIDIDLVQYNHLDPPHSIHDDTRSITHLPSRTPPPCHHLLPPPPHRPNPKSQPPLPAQPSIPRLCPRSERYGPDVQGGSGFKEDHWQGF